MKPHLPCFSSPLTVSDENKPGPRKAGEYYRQIKDQVLRDYSHDDKTFHRHILRELFERAGPCIPFPTSIVDGNPLYEISPEMIDVSPHEFELARLIDKLNWITCLALTEGNASHSMHAELFASRGASRVNVLFAREFDPDDRGFAAAVLRSGSCGENARFATSLAQSLDDETLNFLDIRLDLSKIDLYRVHDVIDDHAFVVLNIRDLDGHSLPEQQGENPVHPDLNKRFHSDIDKKLLWTFDPYPFYPMACRFDKIKYDHKSTYDPVSHTFLHQKEQLGSGKHTMNLDAVRMVRAQVVDRLKLGENSIDIVCQNRFDFWEKIRSRFIERVMLAQGVSSYMKVDTSVLGETDRTKFERKVEALERKVERKMVKPSKFVDRIVREQKVSHYAQVDISALSEADRVKFTAKVDNIEREIGRKLVRNLYRAGEFHECWADAICLPRNPRATYRNSQTGEVLTPTVLGHYLERTERIRWAYDVWKRERPSIAALKSPFVKFDIPRSVEAIEKMPFLSALSAAKAMDLSKNTLYLQGIDELENTLTHFEDWINRMHQELSPALVKKIRSVGLGKEVAAALARTKENLSAFADALDRLDADANALPAESPEKKRLTELRNATALSNAGTQLRELLIAFPL